MTSKGLVAVALIGSLGGCATMPAGEDRVMSLPQAICELQNALITTQRPPQYQAGLKLSKATVVLVLATEKTATNEVSLKVPISVVEIGPKSSRGRKDTEGNTITVEFAPSEDGPWFLARNTDGTLLLDTKGKPITSTASGPTPVPCSINGPVYP